MDNQYEVKLQQFIALSKKDILESFGESLSKFYETKWKPAGLSVLDHKDFDTVIDTKMKMSIALYAGVDLIAQMLGHDLAKAGNHVNQQDLYAHIQRELQMSAEEYRVYFLAQMEAKEAKNEGKILQGS